MPVLVGERKTLVMPFGTSPFQFWPDQQIEAGGRTVHLAELDKAVGAQVDDLVDPETVAEIRHLDDHRRNVGATLRSSYRRFAGDHPGADFGDRFWVYQIVDLRTDSFVQLGKMYGTTPGFYLLVGPNWKGRRAEGHHQSLPLSHNTGIVAPRVFLDDTPEDKRAIQSALPGIMMYPVAEFDGTMKTKDWANLPKAPAPPATEEETQWVLPDKFVDELPASSPTRRRCPAKRRATRRSSRCCRGQGRSEAEAGLYGRREGSGRETREAAVPVP